MNPIVITPNGPPPSPFLTVVSPEPSQAIPATETVNVPLLDLIKDREPEHTTISFNKNSSLEEQVAKHTLEAPPPFTAGRHGF